MGWTSGPPVLEIQERMRANLEEGAKPRFRRRTKVAAVLALIVLLVGSCASVAWFTFAQNFPLQQRIVDRSNGAVRLVLILRTGDSASVQVVTAPGVGDAQAREVACRIVLPELAAAGITRTLELLVYSSNMRLIATGSDPCVSPVPTFLPSPVPNSGDRDIPLSRAPPRAPYEHAGARLA
jgi:hypothetical protein